MMTSRDLFVTGNLGKYDLPMILNPFHIIVLVLHLIHHDQEITRMNRATSSTMKRLDVYVYIIIFLHEHVCVVMLFIQNRNKNCIIFILFFYSVCIYIKNGGNEREDTGGIL